MSTPTAADRLRIRLLAVGDPGDIDTLADGVIDLLYDDSDMGNGDVYGTAAAACELLAAQAARNFRWSADGASMDMTPRVKQYRETAEYLRARIAARTTGVTLTRAATVADSDEWGG